MLEIATAMGKAGAPSRELESTLAHSLGLGTEIERKVYAEHGPAGFTVKLDRFDGFTGPAASQRLLPKAQPSRPRRAPRPTAGAGTDDGRHGATAVSELPQVDTIYGLCAGIR